MSILAGIMLPHPPLAVPEVGGGDEKIIQPTIDGFIKAAKTIAELKPDTIILTSPHSVMYNDFFHISPGRGAKGSFASFRAPEVSMSVTYDDELAKAIESRAKKLQFPAGTMGERDPKLDHGTMVPLYYVNQYYTDYKLVRIGLSGLSLETHYQLGRIIRTANDSLGRRSVFLASGDLSHCQKEDGPYGYKKEGVEYDEKLMAVMKGGNLKELTDFDELFLGEAEECGHRSFTIMAGAFDGIALKPEIMSHEATFGVGYGTGIFMPEKEVLSMSSDDPLVKLATDSIHEFVNNKRVLKTYEIPDIIKGQRAGAFVSVHESGMLRGCIGTILPVRDTLAEEIVRNAVSAVSEDPRFSPVTKEELPDLEINVDILTEPEDISSMDELDVKKYGVIVTSGYKRGLLLPDLEGVDTVIEQVLIAKRKAGIGDREPYTMQRFEVIRHV